MLEVAVGEIVEEDAADAARLAAVLEEKVFVAPALVPGVVLGTHRIAARRMEVLHVLREAVIRREVHATAEPPGVAGAEEANVQVHRRAVGVARMEHERKAHRVVGTPGELRTRRARGRRQCLALYARHVHAGALEYA